MKRTRLKQRGKKSKRDRLTGYVFGSLCDYVRGKECLVPGCEGPGDPHHVRSRGAGFGDWLPDGSGNVVPVCREHHRALHSVGVDTFQDMTATDLAGYAVRVGQHFVRSQADGNQQGA